jgi:uncharacterized membrane protein YsdA (DUF1294 family)
LSESAEKKSSHRSPVKTFSLVGIVLVVIVGALIYFFTRWSFYWIWLISLSIITFLLYGYDKAQAKIGGTRVPEVVLHGLALLGGFVGGWLGRFAFHHKTRKMSFTIVLTIATVLHLGLIILLFLR